MTESSTSGDCFENRNYESRTQGKKLKKLKIFKEAIFNYSNIKTGSEQTSGEHDPHKIREQSITNSLFNEDAITDQSTKNEQENCPHRVRVQNR